MSDVDEIVLGEGVAIDSGAAVVTLRMASGAIDAIAYALLLSGVLILVQPLFLVLNEALVAAIVVTVVVICLVAVPATVEIVTRGLSLGRLALGLRIVRDDSGPITARHAFGRSLLGVFEIYMTFGIVAITASLLSERGKRLGDMFVGSYSMRTRGGRKALPPVTMPASLWNWASTADVTRLPDGIALTSRLFLARAQGMEVTARQRLGTELYRQLLPHVSPPPPAGVHPEEFIAAVIATRRDREYAAALRAEAQKETEASRLARLPFGMTDVDN